MATLYAYDRIEALLEPLGSFWHKSYEARNIVEGLCRARLELEKQAMQNAQEAFDATGVSSISPWHLERWYPVSLLESKRTTGSPVKIGEEEIGQEFVIGGYVGSVASWELPSDLKDCNTLACGMSGYVSWMVKGLDYVIEDGNLIFAEDPFLDPGIVKYETTDTVDVELPIFMFGALFDRKYIQQNYGSVLGRYAETSQAYLSSVQAELNCIAANPSASSFRKLALALADVPYAKESETVEVAQTHNGYHLVVTDKNSYKLSASADLVVSVGDDLAAGDPLTDALLVDFLSSSLPSGLTSLTLPAAMLTGVCDGPLTFSNSTEALTVTTGVSGKTKITFPLTGDSSDITAFFNKLHSNGVSLGKTLANYLDTRAPDSPGEPTAANLPTTINPAAFLLQNVLRGSCALVRGKTAAYGADAAGFSRTETLRKCLSPFTALLIQES